MKKCIILITSILILYGCNENKVVESSSITYNELSENFIDPPSEARPHAYWCWINGNFDTLRLKQELQEAKANGMGGFDIWDVYPVRDEDSIVPAGCAFMNDEYVKAIAFSVREAQKLDLEIGLVISSGWNAGGSWTKQEHSTMGLFQSDTILEGSGIKQISLSFPEIPDKPGKRGEPTVSIFNAKGLPVYYKEIAVLAIPYSVDSTLDLNKTINLSDKTDTNGILTWEMPQGKWLITRYVCFPTGQSLIACSPLSRGPMIDHFNAVATEIHIRYFLDKLKKELGDLSKTAFKRLYTDSYEVRGQLWTPMMAEEFKKRVGYDMLPFLPALNGFIIKDKETTNRFMHDYNKILSDLITENHYAKAKEICNKYGIEFHAEAAGPGKPIHNCPFESLRSSGVLDAPRGEFWHIQEMPGKLRVTAERRLHYDTLLQVIKGPASAAHLYNRKFVDAEAFTSTWLWQEGLYDLKPTADRAFCEGLNRIVFHTFAHNPRIAGKPGWLYSFGTVVNANQTWWDKSRPFMDYLGRCSYMLQQGNFVADVLYYYGDEAPNFVPCKHYIPSLGYGYDYDVVNSDILLNKLEVDKQGKLALPHGQKYSILVLPNDERVNPQVLLKIEKLIQGGATVIGNKPSKYYGLKNYAVKEKEIAKAVDRIWGNGSGSSIKGKGKIIVNKTEKEVLNELKIPADFSIISGISPDKIDWIHRNRNGVDIYFIANKMNKDVSFDAGFRVEGKQPELWNPMNGEKFSCAVYQSAENTIIPISLEAYGSLFVIFEKTDSVRNSVNVSNENKSIFPLDNSQVRNIIFKGNEIIINKPGNYNVNGEVIEVKAIPNAINITGSWKVYFDKAWGGPDSTEFPKLIDWLDSKLDGIKYYSGTARYVKAIDIPQNNISKDNKILLDLGEVAILADVRLNGQNAGILWNKPFITDITSLVKPGKNLLEIEVVNRWPNRLIYDAKLPKEKRLTNSSVRRLPNAFSYPMKDLPNKEFEGLLSSGLIGPVQIKFVKTYSIK